MSRSLGVMLAVVGALAVLTGCAAGPTLSTDATLKYDSRGDYAGLFGTAHVEQADGSLCVYEDSNSGIGKGRVNLIFPGGYSAPRSVTTNHPKSVTDVLMQNCHRCPET